MTSSLSVSYTHLLEPGAIILLHDRMPDSDQLVKQILDLLKEQGYTVVRPDKLLA